MPSEIRPKKGCFDSGRIEPNSAAVIEMDKLDLGVVLRDPRGEF